MAKAMSYVAVFKILLNGGHIVRKSPPVQGKEEYKVFLPGDGLKPDKHVGHITEKQFDEFSCVGLLVEEGKTSMDKYRNIYNVYYLAQKEE